MTLPSRPRPFWPVFLVLLGFPMSGCGDGGLDPVGPDLEEPDVDEPEVPELPITAPVVGDTIWALDLSNRLLLFGSGSLETVSRISGIRGVTLLHRIVGFAMRPSDGRLFGVGNDSHLYVIDPYTSQATRVGSGFEPRINLFFDTHFGMTFDPRTQKILLVSSESGVHWIIDPESGEAERGPTGGIVEGDPNEGETLHLAGLAFASSASATPPMGWAAGASSAQSIPDCDDLLYAIDPDLGYVMGSCDPDEWDWESLFEIPVLEMTRCTETTFGPEGNLFVSILDVASGLNSLYTMDPETGESERLGDMPVDSPIQDFIFP